ncbi:MAG TPA: bifunctional [glutamine synthetase] adenylyltransferase/[glutamine synthetase]-adenylyl-L-tyrosine phosphorylase [Actinocrinis sp.]|nr:bifunctional [glutamine synthetase] adenylyltransferase/[glutamine synthetase]-adenylyl-L-tyrosine phosphorylase [Actinocrinis sp.]
MALERTRESQQSRLIRAGFNEPDRAAAQLADPVLGELGRDPLFLTALGACPDPDVALSAVAALLAACPDPAALRNNLASAKPLRDRLLSVLGISTALGDFLVRHPEALDRLLEFDAPDLPAEAEHFQSFLHDAVEGRTGTAAADALRVAYRTALLTIAARDLSSGAEFSDIGAALADLAGATLSAALDIARAEEPPGAAPCRLAVISMGKCGARELNYVSDVDVIFVAEPVPPPDPEDEPAAPASSGGSAVSAPLAPSGDTMTPTAPTATAGLATPPAAPAKTHAAVPNTPTPAVKATVPATAAVPSAAPAADPARDTAAALASATRLAARMMRICSTTTAEGTIWEVDAALRPEGKAGPLVRTLASHDAYYERWAKTWEFQALLKARPIAGDLQLGADYLALIDPRVWQAAAREHFVDEVQAMRRRVTQHATATLRSAPGSVAVERELKLGPGGLRDIEFAVQLLQLVHGRIDETLRQKSTLDGLRALADGGYVGRTDAAALSSAYEFLRTLEHRIQLLRLERTHTMPSDPVLLRRIGRSMGFLTDPARQLEAAWHEHALGVRRLHEKLFYRPLLSSVARLGTSDTAVPAARLSPSAAQARLAALGYANPAGAFTNIQALTAGLSRRAAIQRTLLPVFLEWFSETPDPDSGLLAFRKLSDALGRTPWYLRSLRDEGQSAGRLARVLSCGDYPVDLILRAPEAVTILNDDEALEPRTRAVLESEMLALVKRAQNAEQAVAAVRGVRRRELFRIVAADVLGLLSPDPVAEVGRALADVTGATIEAALAAVIAFRPAGPPPARLAVIAMGRLGGAEPGYGSDADVLFVYEPEEGDEHREATPTEVTESAFELANELRRLLQLPSTDPPLLIDADLRPEGRQGPLVRSLASYAEYYKRWSHPWEAQALLRAAPIAGSADLGSRFVDLIDPIRYPAGGLADADLREIRRLKARMEAERLPRGADRTLHTKLGPGGLSDIEWVAQLLQLRHGADLPTLRTTGTRPALQAASAAGLLAPADEHLLDDAWRHTSHIRNAVTIVRGQSADQVPTLPRALAGVAHYLAVSSGADPLGTEELLDGQRRRARRARSAFERLFFDD